MISNSPAPSTFISRSDYFDGSLTIEGDLRIAGKFDGSIACQGQVHIVETAKCKAVIRATSIKIDGYVEGDVKALTRIDISEHGVVAGNIGCPTIVVAEGASLCGRCRIDKNSTSSAQPLKQAATIARRKRNGVHGRTEVKAQKVEAGKVAAGKVEATKAGANGSALVDRKTLIDEMLGQREAAAVPSRH